MNFQHAVYVIWTDSAISGIFGGLLVLYILAVWGMKSKKKKIIIYLCIVISIALVKFFVVDIENKSIADIAVDKIEKSTNSAADRIEQKAFAAGEAVYRSKEKLAAIQSAAEEAEKKQKELELMIVDATARKSADEKSIEKLLVEKKNLDEQTRTVWDQKNEVDKLALEASKNLNDANEALKDAQMKKKNIDDILVRFCPELKTIEGAKKLKDINEYVEIGPDTTKDEVIDSLAAVSGYSCSAVCAIVDRKFEKEKKKLKGVASENGK